MTRVLAGVGLVVALAGLNSTALPALGQPAGISSKPLRTLSFSSQVQTGPTRSSMPTGQGFGGPPHPGPGGPGGPDFRPWWKDASIVKEIGLTASQAAQIDRIYETRNKQIAQYLEDFDKERAELDRMFRERTVEPSAIQFQAAKLMTPRVEIDKSRFVMLYRMYRVLTTEQYDKLQAIFERDRGDRGRGRGGNPVGR